MGEVGECGTLVLSCITEDDGGDCGWAFRPRSSALILGLTEAMPFRSVATHRIGAGLR